ncbi:MAG: hypothetical protein ACREDR_44685, partial [Blastocatellia bacterium]
ILKPVRTGFWVQRASVAFPLICAYGFITSRWECFLEDDSVRARLRVVCRNLAETVGSKTIAYIPDSSYKPELALDLLHDGKTIDEIVEWLYVNCGPLLK